MKVIVMALIRHGLTALGGALVGAGVVDESTGQQLVGGGLALAGLVLSIGEKRGWW